MSTPEELAKLIFSQRAAFYTTSAAHKDPQVLARLVTLADPRPEWRALDVATGTGHTAFAVAPYVSKVIATDLTPAMLEEAQKLQRELNVSNVEFRIADAHNLPFDDATFDLVTSRRAPHHFSAINRALGEMKRVLKPGGRLVIDDRSAPEDDFGADVINELDWYHDHSHVREYRPSEWRQMLTQAGFRIEAIEPYTQNRPLTSLTRDVDAEHVAKIHSRLESLTVSQHELFGYRLVDGAAHVNHWYVLLSALA
jgi:ubiquinone/menaquinone biosynthesis C-methylase UbiE